MEKPDFEALEQLHQHLDNYTAFQELAKHYKGASEEDLVRIIFGVYKRAFIDLHYTSKGFVYLPFQGWVKKESATDLQ